MLAILKMRRDAKVGIGDSNYNGSSSNQENNDLQLFPDGEDGYGNISSSFPVTSTNQEFHVTSSNQEYGHSNLYPSFPVTSTNQEFPVTSSYQLYGHSYMYPTFLLQVVIKDFLLAVVIKDMEIMQHLFLSPIIMKKMDMEILRR